MGTGFFGTIVMLIRMQYDREEVLLLEALSQWRIVRQCHCQQKQKE
jgi:hypothetical protein